MNISEKKEWTRRFGDDVFVQINEIHRKVGPLTAVPFWKAVSIGYFLARGLSVHEAISLASDNFDASDIDCYELAKDAKWSGVMPNNAATEFAVFENGELIRKISKDEALQLCPEVRTFPI